MDYTFPASPSDALLHPYNEPQGWSPEGDAYATVFDIPKVDSPAGAHSAVRLFKSTPSPTCYTNSSGPSSPAMSPYTPTTLETLHVPADAWQAQPSLSNFDVETPMPVSLEYQPYAWSNAPDLWVSGSAPMFNEDFDISMIPPISIEVPKFDGLRHVEDQRVQDFLSPQSVEQDGDAFTPMFTFNDASEITIVHGY
jgi:hypothetical protein